MTETESESKNTNTGDDIIVTQPELRDVRTEQQPTLRRSQRAAAAQACDRIHARMLELNEN